MKKPLTTKFYYAIAGLLLVAGATFFFLRNEGRFEGEEEEEEEHEGEEILGAFDLWTKMRAYPAENFSTASYTDAFEFSKKMPKAPQRVTDPRARPESSTWLPLGPQNFSGRVLCLGWDPTNANNMWVGTAAGGLWKSTTGGTGAPSGVNWTYVPTGFPVLGVPSIVVNPTDPDEIYIGTGEVYDADAWASGVSGSGSVRTFRGSYGIGILKTTDGGANWTKTLNFSTSSLIGVMDLAMDPNNPAIVYAATTNGLWRTTNSGGNWTQVSTVASAMSIRYKPGSSTTMYIGFGEFGSTGAGIYRTTNANAATPTFTKITSGLPTVISGKIMLAVTAAAPTNVYASIGNSPYSMSDPEGLYRSTNDGVNWTGVKTGAASVLTNQGWYAHDLAVDPTNVNTIYWGELNLFKSTDAGANFSTQSAWNGWAVPGPVVMGSTSEGTSNYVHGDIHRIYISPTNSSIIYMCTDGGIFRSKTAATTSFDGLNGGLQTVQIYNNVGISTSSTFMIAGLQDNEGVIYNGSPSCQRIGSLGDGFHAAVDPNNENICYIESYYGNILKRSTNKAGSFGTQLFSNPNNPPPPENANFNSPFVLAPSSPSTIYLGTMYIRKTTTPGTSNALAGGTAIMNGGNPLSADSAPVLTISVSKTDANWLYASTIPWQNYGLRSKLWKSTNGASSFTEITNGLPDRYYTKIAVDPNNKDRLVVTLSGFGGSHVYLSNNGGTTWTDIGAGLPDVPVNVAMFDPGNSQSLFIGNDLGFYYANGVPLTGTPASYALTWRSYNTGMEDALIVSDIMISSAGKLRVATYGRGFWEVDIPPVILPAVFNNINVTATDKGNLLKWQIATQQNVSRYEIEYGTDGYVFNKIATVPAKTGATGNIDYSYLHAITNSTDGYYRIRVIDLDGTATYSTVVQVKAASLTTGFAAYPNPTTGLLKMSVPPAITGDATLTIFNAAGQAVMQKRYTSLRGVREISADITPFAAGTYEAVLSNGVTKWQTRILKQK